MRRRGKIAECRVKVVSIPYHIMIVVVLGFEMLFRRQCSGLLTRLAWNKE